MTKQNNALRLAEQISDIRCQTEAEARTIAAAADLLRRQHARIAELEAQLEAVGAGGVQALSAAPEAKKSALRTYPNPIVPLIKPVSEQEKMRALYLASSNLMAYLGRNGAIHSDGHAADVLMNCLNDLDGGEFDETLFAASPTPPAELQAAPKAAQGVGNSGFDHKTAADLLNNKTVSDEAVRKFVATSRWAHDEKAALSAMLLSVRGVLASREAEIALRKKALMEAEAAPQQEAQEPVAWLSPWRADQVTTDYDAYGERGIPLYTAPQPAPAPLSDDVVRDAARYRWLRDVPMAEWPDELATAFQLQQNAIWDAAIDAAIAAQGGKV